VIRPWKSQNLAQVWREALDDAFFSDAFERKPVLVRGAYVDREPAITLDDLERLLICPPGARFSDVRVSRVGADGRVDAQSMPPDFKLATVLERYRAGYSVMLDQINYRWPPIYALCMALQERLAAAAPSIMRGRATCSAFLTPPHAQGHPRHYDRDDAYALQVEGRKTWRFWAPVREAPLHNSSQEAVDLTALGEPDYEFVLEPGDVLYFPRGFVHEPFTGDLHSLHLSFGVIPVNWSQLLGEMLESHPAFRRSVPRAFLAEDGAELLRADLSAMLALLDDPQAVRAWIARARRSQLEGENQTAAGRLAEAASAAGARGPGSARDSVLTKRYGARYHVEPSDGMHALAFPGMSIRIPSGCSAALEVMLRTVRFTAEDVRAGLSDHDLDALISQLLDAGFLCVVGDDGET